MAPNHSYVPSFPGLRLGLVKHLFFQSNSEKEVLVSKKAFLDFSNYCVNISNEKEDGNVSAGNR